VGPTVDSVAAILRAEFAKEYAAGLPMLRRIPATGAIRFLDYFESLDPTAQLELFDAMALASAMHFFPPPMIARQHEELRTSNPAFRRLLEEMTQSPRYTMGLRYVDLRMRKAMLGDAQSVAVMAETRAKLDWTPRDDVRADLVPDIDNARIAKAADLRKPIDAMLRELFAIAKKKLPGGETEYGGALDGREISVAIDFSARGIQLRTGITILDPARRVFVHRMVFEDLWACGYPGWDYLTEENSARSIEVLREQIVNLVGLVNRIAPV
jgi:hypothetical protein